MDRKILRVWGGVFVMMVAAVCVSIVYSHCQIPCGIYGDRSRIDAVSENLVTIEKSMRQITALSTEKHGDMNQIVRWVVNKEKHADDISGIITYYFMAQRIKPVEKSQAKEYATYIEQITLLHEMLIETMKTKQGTDMDSVTKLRQLLKKFEKSYFAEP